MPKKLASVDLTKPPAHQPTPVHNRWHPDIPPVATVPQNEVFRVEMVRITNNYKQFN
jgi:formamidase